MVHGLSVLMDLGRMSTMMSKVSLKRISAEERQAIHLALLDELLRICSNLNIRVFLCGGTLLGAVRHHGFIPWDDDMDVMMFREDYEKLLQGFSRRGHYELRSYHTTPDYPFLYASLCDTRTIKVERNLRDRYTEALCVNIDIFPIDLLSGDASFGRCFKKVSAFDDALKCSTYCFGKGTGRISTIRKNLGILVYRLFGGCFASNPKRILQRWDHFCTSQGSPSSTFAAILAIDHYGAREVNLLTEYSASISVEFEGRQCFAPSGYMGYLHKLYGKDCLELPPPEKRVTHHESDCFWRSDNG